MKSPTVYLDMKVQIQAYSEFEGLYLEMEQKLGHMVLLNINRKPYIGSPPNP